MFSDSIFRLRLYRQTYFGIRDVLYPLARDQQVCVLPMQSVLPDRAWILKICPASTLKRENLYLRRYKRGTDEGYEGTFPVCAEKGTGHLSADRLAGGVH